MRLPRVRRPPLREVGQDPDYRFSLANERTFLAWIRTSLALLAAGVAVIQIIPSFGPPGGRLALGVVLIVLALILAAASYPRWEGVERAMRLGRSLPESVVSRVVAYGLGAVAVLSLILIVLDAGTGR
ncbi:MAG: DUF202 domain-containing protein [Streptosporangiales bacterium]|nr:DUF202 domain-containing protein [Streptosporangiales bacterium]